MKARTKLQQRVYSLNQRLAPISENRKNGHSSIESVAEHLEEGILMHHCVFTNDYYSRPHSLILTAQIGEEHIETVEVSLETFQVVQSRGVCNKPTEYHDRIVNLVERNMDLIRRRMSA